MVLSVTKKEIINCPAFANEVVDKVGAGDSFYLLFLYAVLWVSKYAFFVYW